MEIEPITVEELNKYIKTKIEDYSSILI